MRLGDQQSSGTSGRTCAESIRLDQRATEPSPAWWHAAAMATPTIPPPTTKTSGRRSGRSGNPGIERRPFAAGELVEPDTAFIHHTNIIAVKMRASAISGYPATKPGVGKRQRRS